MPEPVTETSRYFISYCPDSVHEFLVARFYGIVDDSGYTELIDREVITKTLLDAVVPSSAETVLSYEGEENSDGSGGAYRSMLLVEPNLVIHLRRMRGVLYTTVAGADRQDCVDWYDANVTPHVEPPDPPPPGAVSVRFWHRKSHGPPERKIETPEWHDAFRNYSATTQTYLGELMAWRPDEGTGRIGILHGPPGTGKTSALRSLAYEWRDWCSMEYVVDPEEFFREPSYMFSVVIDHSRNADVKWRMVVVEDAEEFLVPNAKSMVGQSIARLLNLGDGIVGQGLRVLIFLTTNAPTASLHDAITRPGRCFADIEIPKMSAAEASEWLGHPAKREMTLAELYAAKRKGDGHSVRIGAPMTHTSGSYL